MRIEHVLANVPRREMYQTHRYRHLVAFKSPESDDESENGSDDEAKTSEEFIQQGDPQIIYDPKFCHRDFDFGHHRYPGQFNGSNIFEDNKINQVCIMLTQA